MAALSALTNWPKRVLSDPKNLEQKAPCDHGLKYKMIFNFQFLVKEKKNATKTASFRVRKSGQRR